MKQFLFALILLLSTFAVQAQRDYLLQPTDSGMVIIKESARLKQISRQKIKFNKLKPGIEGYRIEIYLGKKRKDATEIIEAFKEEYPEVSADLTVENPYVKVKVGAFRSKLEAQELYQILKKEFDGARIVKVYNMKYPSLYPINYQKEDD